MAMVEYSLGTGINPEQLAQGAYEPYAVFQDSLRAEDIDQRKALLAQFAASPKQLTLDNLTAAEEAFEEFMTAAANPDDALTARSLYLEAGFRMLRSIGPGYQRTIDLESVEKNAPRLSERYMDAIKLIPAYFNDHSYNQAREIQEPQYYEDSHPFLNLHEYQLRTGKLFREVIEHDGWTEEHLLNSDLDTSWYGVSSEEMSATGMSPLSMFMLVDAMVSIDGWQLSSALGMDDFWTLINVALNYNTDEFRDNLSANGQPKRDDEIAHRVLRARALRAGHWGKDHITPVQALRDDNSLHSRRALESLGRLSTTIHGLAEVFPVRARDSVKRGAQQLTSNAAYALAPLIDAEEIASDITLSSGNVLPVQYRRGEAPDLLNGLNDVIYHLGELWTSETVRTVKAIDGAGFAIWRFIDLQHVLPAATSLSIRPFGSVSFDGEFEFGRLGQGAEASISYTTDASLLGSGNQGMIELGKRSSRPIDGRISIRLDREGIAPNLRSDAGVLHDPTQQDGTTSLDIGSVGGHAKSFGTRVGRLLAYGNSRRASKLDIPSGLNHVTSTFRSEHGTANNFASMALDMQARATEIEATGTELADYANGVLAIRKGR